jgi:hypothetical protein
MDEIFLTCAEGKHREETAREYEIIKRDHLEANISQGKSLNDTVRWHGHIFRINAKRIPKKM